MAPRTQTALPPTAVLRSRRHLLRGGLALGGLGVAGGATCVWGGVRRDAPAASAMGFDRPLRVEVQDASIEFRPEERAWLLRSARVEERVELRPPRGAASESSGEQQAFRLARAYFRAHDPDVSA
ncbi:MAG: hypothetical protein ACRDJN_02125, partial [Chloroflexota bacterium]